MGKKESCCWFKVIVDYELPLVYILCARNRRQVHAYFKGQLFVYRLIPLSWLAISKLTGCTIPSRVIPASHARGDLVFDRTDKLTVLTSISELGR